MKITTTKMCLLGSAALAVISTPVLANHNAMPLRGSWNAAQYAMPATAAVPARQVYVERQQAQPCYAPCTVNTRTVYAVRPQQQVQYAPQHKGPATYPQQDTSQHVHSAPQQPYYGQQVELNSHLSGPMGPWTRPAPVAVQPKRKSLMNLFGLRGRSDARAHMVESIPQPQPQYTPTPVQYAGNNYDVGGISVRTSAAHTGRMLDWQENTTGKALTLLQHRRNGVLAPNSLYLGAGIKGGLMWQKTEVPGQFPLLSRFPDFSNRTDDQTGVFAINNAALAITGTFGDWTTIYLQPEYSETEFFSQGEMQLRKAFVTFGNLDKTPFYAAFGRKTIDFGNFDGYNPFTHTESQHYFWAQTDQPVLELGFYDNGLKVTASAFSAGRQLRTAYAGEENNLGNYAASIEKEWLIGKDSAFTVGTSYLHDSIYRNNWTAHTFNAILTGTPPANFIEYQNPVVSAFAEYNSDVFDAMIEYTTTMEPWGAAIPQDAAGNIVPGYEDFDEKLAVTVAQVRYKPRMFDGRTAFSAVGSWGNISDEDYVGTTPFGTEVTFGKNQQHVLGVEHSFNEYIDFGAEYVYNKGFIPFVAPQLVSNQDTEAHAVNIGFKARF